MSRNDPVTTGGTGDLAMADNTAGEQPASYGDNTLGERRPEAAPLQKIELVDGALTISGSPESHAYLERALGTVSGDFLAYAVRQLVNLLPEKTDETDFTLDVNGALAMLTAINPRDELEAMLAVQMVATNHLALLSMRRTRHAQVLEGRQANGNLATKFSRTFTAQIEALDRHRRGGKQIVEHVHVNAGGQAVIAGTVNTRQGG